MKYRFSLLFPLVFLAALPRTGWSIDVPATLQLRDDIGVTITDLQNAKAERNAAENDLALSQKELMAVEGRMHTPQEQTILIDRVQKDRLGSWTFLQEIFKDLAYLRSQWGFLTPEERATVDEITRQLTQGT